MPASPRTFRRAVSLAAVFAPLLACIAPPATAQIERCVGNLAQFNAAWALGQSEAVTIKMTAGVWNMAGSRIEMNGPSYMDFDESMTLKGGYNANCTSRSEDPGATVLTGASLEISGWPFATPLRVERLTFRNVPEAKLWGGENVVLERIWFDRVGAGYVSGDRVLLHNGLVTDSGGTQGQNGNCAIEVNAYRLDRVQVEHSTFARNMGDGALCIVRDDSPPTDDWRLHLYSNVFWDNSRDVRLRKRSAVSNIEVHAHNNLFGNGILANRPTTPSPVATLTSNPQFADPAGGDWRLGGASPAINSGRVDVNLFNQADFEGNTRWRGTAPDRGAFESGIGSTATVLTVTHTGDSGAGSLRQALTDANAAPNFNRIHFNIPGACPRVIALASLLPTIAHPVAIDGYTQPGASRNTTATGNNATLCVVIEGNDQITGAYGLNVATDASPEATVSIEGLAFSGHSIAAVQFAGGRDHRLAGVRIGGTAGAYGLRPSGIGVRVGGATQGVRIGGPNAGDRNIMVGALGAGISVSGTGANQPHDTTIENNFIGTANGSDTLGNHRGILISGGGHTIRNNVISGNLSHGIELSGGDVVDTVVLDNRIGIPAACAGPCGNRGNGGHGVRIAGGASASIVQHNHIAFNGGDGVAVVTGDLNTIRRNLFHDNAGIGIDLADDGIDLFDGNNSAPPPNAANGGQNKPVLAAVEGGGGGAWIDGALYSANGAYRIDFHAAKECTLLVLGGFPLGFWGQGEEWLGSAVVHIENGLDGVSDGSATFADALLTAPAGSSGYFDTPRWITATATRLFGDPESPYFLYRGTSEFSRCAYSVPGAGIFADGFE